MMTASGDVWLPVETERVGKNAEQSSADGNMLRVSEALPGASCRQES
jgi:hypothetical protein